MELFRIKQRVKTVGETEEILSPKKGSLRKASLFAKTLGPGGKKSRERNGSQEANKVCTKEVQEE